MRSTLAPPWSFLFLVACGAFGPVACGSCSKPDGATAADSGGGATTAAATDASPSTSGSAARRSMPFRGGGGPAGMILAAARSLDLKEDQKAKLDKAEQALRGDEASARDEMKALHTTLVAGIRAGKLDQAKIDADLAALDKAANDRKEKEATALNDIYAALEPAQRTEIVTKLRERQASQERRMAARMGARADGGAPDGGARGAMNGAKRIERLTRDLDLDAEQQKKAQAIAPKDEAKAPPPAEARAEAKKHMDALLAAFEKDGFDAKKLEIADQKRAKAAASEEVKLIAGLLPILKPEQREKLAVRMEKQPGPGGPGARARGPRGRHGLPHKLGPGESIEEDSLDDDDDDEAPAPGGSASAGPSRE